MDGKWVISCGRARLDSLSVEGVRAELARLGEKFPGGSQAPTVVVETPSGNKVAVSVGEHSLLDLLKFDAVI